MSVTGGGRRGGRGRHGGMFTGDPHQHQNTLTVPLYPFFYLINFFY